jgi:hypothetical protein
VFSPSQPTSNSRVCYPQPTTDGRVVILARVWIGLKGISRVIPVFVSPTLGIRIGLKGLATVMPLPVSVGP